MYNAPIRRRGGKWCTTMQPIQHLDDKLGSAEQKLAQRRWQKKIWVWKKKMSATASGHEMGIFWSSFLIQTGN